VVNGLGDGMPWPQPLIQWEVTILHYMV
jgi:hypothetical protein